MVLNSNVCEQLSKRSLLAASVMQSFFVCLQSFGVRKLMIFEPPCLRLHANKAEAWLSCLVYNYQSTAIFEYLSYPLSALHITKLTKYANEQTCKHLFLDTASVFCMPKPTHLRQNRQRYALLFFYFAQKRKVIKYPIIKQEKSLAASGRKSSAGIRGPFKAI